MRKIIMYDVQDPLEVIKSLQETSEIRVTGYAQTGKVFEFSVITIEPEPEPEPDEFEPSWRARLALDMSDECSMCGKERPLNENGRCSSCETVWNS